MLITAASLAVGCVIGAYVTTTFDHWLARFLAAFGIILAACGIAEMVPALINRDDKR